jgi:hypothetical protein
VTIILGFADNPPITPHEANALALLLSTVGTDGAISLAAKLQQQAAAEGPEAPIELTGPERSALSEAIGSFRRDRLPEHMLSLGDALAADLGSGTP